MKAAGKQRYSMPSCDLLHVSISISIENAGDISGRE